MGRVTSPFHKKELDLSFKKHRTWSDPRKITRIRIRPKNLPYKTFYISLPHKTSMCRKIFTQSKAWIIIIFKTKIFLSSLLISIMVSVCSSSSSPSWRQSSWQHSTRLVASFCYQICLTIKGPRGGIQKTWKYLTALFLVADAPMKRLY